MVNFHLQTSGSIRLHITINAVRHRLTIPNLKANKDKWMNQRIIGKNSIKANQELDRISNEIEEWVNDNPVHTMSKDQISIKLEKIILKSDFIEKRKVISEYFVDFLQEKKFEVNPNTKHLIKPATIQSYVTAFDHFKDFGILELEQINKVTYHKFLNFLIQKVGTNTAGKNIKRMKAFFNWCHNEGLPINSGYKHWKPISEETKKEDRALNSKQLNQIYTLVIDPIDIYQIAKRKHGKSLDAKHVEQLTKSVDEARKQAVAMASIGAHKEDFWALTDKNIVGNMIKYKRGKNNIQCSAPFRDNSVFHAKEFANLSGGFLFKRMAGKFNYYLTYIEVLCNLPFHITAKTFRKTFASISWFELEHPNKRGVIMEALGHTSEHNLKKYLGIQDDDLERDHEEMFNI